MIALTLLWNLSFFYSFCQKLKQIAVSEIHLNPLHSKGDFRSNFLAFPPFEKGGLGGILAFMHFPTTEKLLAFTITTADNQED
jgi:hypothetical protein